MKQILRKLPNSPLFVISLDEICIPLIFLLLLFFGHRYLPHRLKKLRRRSTNAAELQQQEASAMQASIVGQTPVAMDINKPARGSQQNRATNGTVKRRGKGAILLTLLLAVIGIAAQGALAQSVTGDVVVTVTDPTGAVLPKATLVLTQVDTAQQTTLASDSSGIGVFAQLKPGPYKLSVSAPGFKSTQLDNITVVIGQRSALDVSMQVGSVDNTVTISAAGASLLNSESAAVGQVMNQTSIEELPLNGRNFIQLTQLTTGTNPVGQGNSPATTWTGRSDTTVSFAGLRESDTSYLLNGIETRNARFGNTGIRPSVDAIQEFRVQRTTFGAEFGHSASIVNTDLLSGGNGFHLVVFELNRNKAYAANDYFSNQSGTPQPSLNQNNYGTTFSGPVIIPHLYNGRDKTFFMFNYEAFRLGKGVPLNGIYPSAAQLAGNLADNSAGTGIFPTSSAACQVTPLPSQCVDIIDPFTKAPYAGNVIPTARLDPTALKALPYVLTSNIAPVFSSTGSLSYNTHESPKSVQHIDQYNVRLDQRISARDSVYATWSNSNDNLLTPSINPLGGNNAPLNDHLWTATYTHIFGNTIFNELRGGVNDSATFRNAQTAYGPNYALSLFGLDYGNNSDPATFGIPNFSLGGGFGPVGSITEVIGADDKNYQVADNLSITHGKLTSLNGVQLIHERFNQITDFGSNPNLAYTEGYSGSTLADFLLGAPFSITGAQGDSSQQLHTNYYGLYSQNNYKLRPNLTVTAGLRYEFAASPIESRNHSQYFDFNTGQFLYAGTSIRRSIVKPDYNNLAPRLGFAYRPGGDLFKNTVIRGGAGIYYSTDNFNEEQFKNQGSPFYSSRSNTTSTTTPVSIFNPFVGTSTSFPPAGANIFDIDQNNRTPYIEQYGLSVQREFGGEYLVEVEYAGGAGRKLPQRYNYNIRQDSTSAPAYPQYGFILVTGDYGRSNFNALTAKLEKRFTNGTSFLVAYTYSKAIDIGITDDFSALSRDFFTYDRGVSDYDVPNRLVVSYDYHLPVGRGQRFLGSAPRAVDYALGGWQLNGISTFSSGQYSTPVLSGGKTDLNIGTFSVTRPNRVGDPSAGRKAPSQWFNPAAFAAPATLVPGSAGRNSIEQPGYQNWDMSLFKAVAVTEKSSFQLRFEAFNVFNHTQFGFANTTYGVTRDPNTNVVNYDTTSGFGSISSVRPGSPRVIQLGGRFSF
jgi:hypothetical protein